MHGFKILSAGRFASFCWLCIFMAQFCALMIKKISLLFGFIIHTSKIQINWHISSMKGTEQLWAGNRKKVQSLLGTGTHLQKLKEIGITKSDLSKSTIGLEAYHVEDWNAVATAVVYDKSIKAIRVRVPGTTEEFYLHPATVRRNDKSAKSIVLTSFLEFCVFHCIDNYKFKSTMPMFANTGMIYRVSLSACLLPQSRGGLFKWSEAWQLDRPLFLPFSNFSLFLPMLF